MMKTMFLIFVACASEGHCKDVSMQVEACPYRAQAVLASFISEHPMLKIKTWKCSDRPEKGI